ncbi:MAG: ferric reductase-like transmembrane domain-containing protein, partial [Phycisphaerae bacterium]
MSVAYRAVQWNRHKILYDIILVAGVLLYVTTFLLVSRLTLRDRAAPAMEVLLMRALGTCAFVMLQIILSIGPLARLSPRFNPILYNRRHFGVTLFCVALAHGLIALGYYHGFGNVNPFLSLLTNGGSYASFAQFPFQILGAVALMILFLMAATSHDFWLKNLTPPVWKSLHMLVYVAYGLLVLHMVLGALQSERSPI